MSRHCKNCWLTVKARAASRCAFTLLELLIVTALLAGLAAFSWPAMRRSFDRTEHRRVVDEVRTLLSEARTRALSRRRPQLVCVDPLQTEIAIYEVAFDEADAAQFDGDASDPNASPLRRHSRKNATSDNSYAASQGNETESQDPLATPSASNRRSQQNIDDDDATLRQSHDLAPDRVAGSNLKLVQSITLPDNFHCRAASSGVDRVSQSMTDDSHHDDAHHDNLRHGDLPGFPGDRLPDAEQDDFPIGHDDPLSSERAPQVVFDVAGKTADALWEIVGPGGYCTPLSVAGALGSMQIGHRHGKQTRETESRQREAFP